MLDIITGGPEAAFKRELDTYLGKGERKRNRILKGILAGVGEAAAGFSGQKTPIQRMQEAARDTWKTQVPALSRESIADQNNAVRMADIDRKYKESLEKFALENQKAAEVVAARIQKGELTREQYLLNKPKIEAEAAALLAKADSTKAVIPWLERYGTPTKEIANATFGMESPDNQNALTRAALLPQTAKLLGMATGSPGITRNSTNTRIVESIDPFTGGIKREPVTGSSTSRSGGVAPNPDAQSVVQMLLGGQGGQQVDTSLIPGRSASPTTEPPASTPQLLRPPQDIIPPPTPVPPGNKSRELPAAFTPVMIKMVDREKVGFSPKALPKFEERSQAYQTGIRLTSVLNSALKRAVEDRATFSDTLTGKARVGGIRSKGEGYSPKNLFRGILSNDPLETDMTSTLREEYANYQRLMSGLTVTDNEKRQLEATKPNDKMLAEDLVQEIIKLRLMSEFFAWRDGAGVVLARRYQGVGETDPETNRILYGSEALNVIRDQAKRLSSTLGYNSKTQKFDQKSKATSIEDRWFDPENYLIPYIKSKRVRK